MINTREIAAEYRLAHWAQVMQERVQSGLSIKDFCKQIGICGNTYFYWQRRVRAAACEQLAKLEPIQKASFSEVVVAEANHLLVPAEPVPHLRIEAAGVQITADSAYPADKLALLLRELMRPC
jgi:transposase-like protein